MSDVKAIESPIEQPIEKQHTGKGNPSAVLHCGRPLNNRQARLLEKLPEYDSRVTVPKNTASMFDLAALTAATGVEYAMFTKGRERLIIRGDERKVNVDIELAKELSGKGYRWSGHTHPQANINYVFASDGDKAILECFNQQYSVIYNSVGNFRIFEKR
ncbi:MAG: hypothetical protein LBI36_04735 [Oscillospiraceae bacterium]|jgi:hypothetical protein|nr:hypothetical protein [Oscillospiraceae bacterium]